MPDRKVIMLVDDNITNLNTGKSLLEEAFDVFTIPSGEKLLKTLDRVTPDLILLDIEMPEMSGYEVIATLKANPKTKNIPVIFLTARADFSDENVGLSLGAIDYISKPFSPQRLLRSVERSFRIKKNDS